MVRKFALGLATAIAAITAAFGDEVPFATPPSPVHMVAALPDIYGENTAPPH